MSPEPIAPLRFDRFLESIAARTPAPGGGAVASAAGALSAALAGMVVGYSLGKKTPAVHEPALQDAARRLATARSLFLRLADEDAAAYAALNELSRLEATDPRRATELPGAVLASVQVPMAVMAACADVLGLMESLAPITNHQLRSDLAIAAVMGEGAARSSRWNILVNVGSLQSDAERNVATAQASQLLSKCLAHSKAIETACRE